MAEYESVKQVSVLVLCYNINSLIPAVWPVVRINANTGNTTIGNWWTVV